MTLLIRYRLIAIVSYRYPANEIYGLDITCDCRHSVDVGVQISPIFTSFR